MGKDWPVCFLVGFDPKLRLGSKRKFRVKTDFVAGFARYIEIGEGTVSVH
jgi:hypothetical protein